MLQGLRHMTGFPPGIAYIDNEFVPISQARISVLDWGLLRSDATYDVVHVWKSRFFRLDHHLDRFMASVDKLRMKLPFERDGLEHILHQCVARSGLQNAYVEMVLTRGVSPTVSRDPRDAINNFFAFVIPFGWIADETQRARGLRVHIASVTRIPPSSLDPTVKNYHWLDLVQGLYEAYDAGKENVFLGDGKGNITEGPGFNIFAVKNGEVLTPERGVLQGITRQTALELCNELGVKTRKGELSEVVLKAADEVFVTSTAGGIVAIAEIDDVKIGDKVPGPITQKLTELYWSKHSAPEWTTIVKSQEELGGTDVICV